MKPDGALRLPIHCNLSEESVMDAIRTIECVDTGDGIFLHLKCAYANWGTAAAIERGILQTRGNVILTWALSPLLAESEWTLKDIATGKLLYSEGC